MDGVLAKYDRNAYKEDPTHMNVSLRPKTSITSDMSLLTTK